MKYILLISQIMLGLLLQAQTDKVIAHIPPSSQSQTREARPSDTRPFDPSVERLPPNYSGVDLGLISARLRERRARALEKDEFETTEQFRLRVQKEAAAPILGNIRGDSIVAVRATEVGARYDADQQMMTVKLIPSTAFQRVLFINLKESGSVVEQIAMDIPMAKITKPNLGALAVIKLNLSGKDGVTYSSTVAAELIEIWFYDIMTGQIFLKRRIDELKFKLLDTLTEARELYAVGRDHEALQEVRRVLAVEPMNAEAYLLIGRIQQRAGNQEAAISVLKTAIFWDAKLIDAHILLGRIYLERGDRGEAIKYATSAINIDPNNQEAIALQRQVAMGSR